MQSRGQACNSSVSEPRQRGASGSSGMFRKQDVAGWADYNEEFGYNSEHNEKHWSTLNRGK